MGNQEMKSAMSRIRSKDFNAGELAPWEEKLWSTNDSNQLSPFRDLLSCDKPDKLHSATSRINIEDSGIDSDEKRYEDQARQLIQAGYLNSEKMLESLKQGDYKQIVIPQNQEAEKFELSMRVKVEILVALFFARTQGGADSQENFWTFARKFMKKQSNGFNINSTLNTLLLSPPSHILSTLKSEPRSVKLCLQQIMSVLEPVGPANNFQADAEGFAEDLVFQRVRELLLALLESSECDDELRKLCLHLLMQIGLVRASAEDLLRAAMLQQKHSIDLSRLLAFFCKQKEVWKKPIGEGRSGDYDLKDKHTIQSRVGFSRGSDRAHEDNAFCTDGSNWFIYDHDRGLSRGRKAPESCEWSCENQDDDTSYRCMTMFCHQGQLLVRMESNPDVAFVVFDKETLKPAEGAAPYVTTADSEGQLNWTPSDTQYQENTSDGNRWTRSQSFFSDGELIYTLVQYRQSGMASRVIRTCLEIYEVDGQELRRCQEVPLFKNDQGEPFTGKSSLNNDRYLLMGSIACNGAVLIWHSSHRFHMFDVSSGIRFKKEHLSSSALISTYDAKENYYFHMDAACYSWLKRFRPGGFKPRVITLEKKKHAELPVVFDSIKDELTAHIKANEVEKKPDEAGESPLTNLFNQLLKNHAPEDCSDQVKQVEESKVEPFEGVHDGTISIILAKMSTEAQTTSFKLRQLGEKQLQGEEMLNYIKRKFSVSCSQGYFSVLTEAIEEFIAKVIQGRVTTKVQKNLLDLIHIFVANIECMVACRIQFTELLSKSELLKIKQMQDQLDEIQLFEGQQSKQDVDMSPEELFQLHLYSEAGHLNQLIELHLDIEPRSTKLQAISDALGDNSGSSTGLIRRYLSSISTKRGMKKLFDGSREELKQSRLVLKKCLKFIEEKVRARINAGFEARQLSLTYQSGFFKEVLTFVRFYCQELFVNFGFDMLTILDNKDVPREGELSQQDKAKLEALKAAEARKKVLEELIFETFIIVSQSLQDTMKIVTEHVKVTKINEWGQKEQQKELFDQLSKLFLDEDSAGRLCMTFSLVISSYKAEMLWLDEGAEALRNCATALDSYLLMKRNLPYADRKAFAECDTFEELVEGVQRQVCFSIGLVANHLIQYNAEQADDCKNINKLNILQGGVEARFIPSLTQETKDQIEGSFKLTNDARMQKLAQQQAGSVIKEAQDMLLSSIIDSYESKPEVESTIKLLQQGLLSKVPICTVARLGGDNGMRLTRAAFAVLIKCTDNITGFIRLIEDVSFNLRDRSEETETAKLKEVVKQLKEAKHEEFERYLKQWEQASQMRQWTQNVKLQISEAARKEAEQATSEEINADNPSAEPHSGPFNDEQSQVVEKRELEIFDAKLKATFDSTVDKAKFLVKLAVPRAFQQLKAKETMNTVKIGLAARLSSLAKQKSTVGGVARRSSLMQQIPALGRNASVTSNDGPSDMTVMNANALSRKKSILVRTSTINETEKEFDWRDRLKQWKQVSQSAGAVTSFADQKVEAIQSSAFSVLGILQAPITSEKLQERVETALVSGLRRSAGLTLINFAMNLSFSTTRFFDIVQWLQGSLRCNQMRVLHCLTGVEGSGNIAEIGIKEQFAQIIERILDVIKNEKLDDQNQYVHLLNALCWDYTADDHQMLERLEVFSILNKGNSELTHPIHASWGMQKTFFQIELDRSTNFNLPARLQQVFFFLVNNVLDQVFVKRTKERLEVDTEKASSSVSLLSGGTIQDTETSLRLLAGISQTLFDNVERYLVTAKPANKGGKGDSQPILEMNRGLETAQEDNIFPKDIADKVDAQGGVAKLKIETAIRQFKDGEKVSLLSRKVQEQGSASMDDSCELATLIKKLTRSTAHMQPSLEQAVQILSERRFRAVALIKSTSWEELGIAEPKLSREEMATICGLTKEEFDKAIPQEQKPELEEEKKEVSAFEVEENVQRSEASENETEQPACKAAAGTLKCNAGHIMRMLWEACDRERGNRLYSVGSGVTCDICNKSLSHNRERKDPYFRCAWADCDYDVCRDCGVERGGVQVVKPKQTLQCSNNHFMYMLFDPLASVGGSGHNIRCDLCRTQITDKQNGYYKCMMRSCDYDVCRSCGNRDGGIAVPKPQGGLRCSNNHLMKMRYAPEPLSIRGGRNLYCDICRKNMKPELQDGYFRCLTNCNYDVCRDCGLQRGGVDADAAMMSLSVEALKENAEKLKKAKEELAEQEKKLIELEDGQERMDQSFEITKKKLEIAQAEIIARASCAPEDQPEGQEYSLPALTEIINQMAQLICISADKPDNFEVVRCFTDPRNLQLLIHLSVVAPIQQQLMVQKIMQQLLALDLPQQTFDEAVRGAAAQEQEDRKNAVAEILNVKSCIEFNKSPFLQFLFNRQQVARACIYNVESQQLQLESVLQEQQNTVRQLLTDTTKNSNLRKIINAQIRDSLVMLAVEEMSVSEVDAILSFLPEASVKSVSVGQPCIGKQGKQYRVLGLSNVKSSKLRQRIIHPEYSDSKNFVLVQSYDPLNLERQDVLTVPIFEPTPLLDMNVAEIEAAAEASILMEPEILEVVLDILQSQSDEKDEEESKMRLQMLKTFFVRGIFRMLDILKQDFLENLQQFGLLEPLVKHLLSNVSMKVPAVVRDQDSCGSDSDNEFLEEERMQMTHTSAGLEASLSFMRNQFMYGHEALRPVAPVRGIALQKTNGAKFFSALYVEKDQSQEGIGLDYPFLFRILRQQGKHADDDFKNTIDSNAPNDERSIQLISAEQLERLDKATLTLIRNLNTVITQDSTRFYILGEKIASYVQNEESYEMARKVLKRTYYTVSDADFATLQQMMDPKQEKPNSATLGKAGYYITNLVQQLQTDCAYPQALRDHVNDDIMAQLKLNQGTWDEVCEYFKTMLFAAADRISDDDAKIEAVCFLDEKFAAMTKPTPEEDARKLAKKKEEARLAEEAKKVAEEAEREEAKQAEEQTTEAVQVSTEQRERALSQGSEKVAQSDIGTSSKSNAEGDDISEAAKAQLAKAPLETNFSLLISSPKQFESMVQNAFWVDDQHDKKDPYHEESKAAECFQVMLKLKSDAEKEGHSICMRTLKLLELSTSRDALIMILAEGAEILEQESLALIKSEATFKQICDLVHFQYQSASFDQRIFLRGNLIERTEQQTVALLDLMSTVPGFKTAFATDLLQRAKSMVEKWLKVNHVWSYKGFYGKNEDAKKYLDPASLMFFSRLLIEKDYHEEGQRLEITKSLFDVTLGYALIFSKKDDYHLTHELLSQAVHFLNLLDENLEALSTKDELLKDLFSSKLLQALGMGMDVSGSLSKRRKLILEFMTRIAKIQERLHQKFDKDVPLAFELHESLRQSLKIFRVVEEGNKFSSFIGKIKLKAMLSSEIDAAKVSHIIKQYRTSAHKFETGFSREIQATNDDIFIRVDKNTSNELIKVTHEDGRMFLIDSQAVRVGKNSKMPIAKGQKATIEFPSYPQILQYSGSIRTRHDVYNSYDTWTKLENSTQAAPVQVLAMHNAFTLVGGDGSIWGAGFRANGSGREQEELHKIQMPSDCRNFKKVIQGKFNRVILTEKNELFFSGQPRKYMFGSGTSTSYDSLVKVRDNFYRIDDGDSIIDICGGRHYTAIVTKNGKAYASGYMFYRSMSGCRRNNENDEDYPYELKMKEGWLAQQVFGTERYSNIWVTCKNSETGEMRTFGAGQDEDVTGHNSGDSTSMFERLAVPEGTYFKQISSQRCLVFGIDQDQNMWQWGRHFGASDAMQEIYGVPEVCRRSKPEQLKWFKEKELKTLEVQCASEFAVVRTKDKDGKQEFYMVSSNLEENKKCAGGPITTLCHNQIGKIEVNAEQISSFACTLFATLFLYAKKPEMQSMDPENEGTTGLLHFYQELGEKEIDGKKVGQWKFLTQAQYEERKDSLPDVCFATRHCIKDLAEAVKKIHQNTAESSDWLYSGLPDLIENGVQINEAATEHEQRATNGGAAVAAASPLYYAFSSVDGQQSKVFATEAEALQGGQDWDLSPVIYYRLKKPVTSLESLPAIDINALFSKVEQEDSQIAFTISKSNINMREVDSLELSDEATIARLDKVLNFTIDQDEQILREVDKQLVNKLNNSSIENVAPGAIELTKDMFRMESSLQEIDLELIQMRKELLVKFNKAFSQMRSYINVSQRNIEGTLSHIHYERRIYSLASVINKMIDQQLSQISEGEKPEIYVNRRKAMVFADEGNIDHEGRNSIYGQIVQQLKQLGPSDLNNFRKKNVDGRIYKINFRGEGSIDAGGPFRDSLTNIVAEMESGYVPLLIKSPNNRNDHGSNRDCFILDPSSKSPAHLEMFKYLGAFIAFSILSKSPVPLNLAPTVWKQILGQSLDLNDLMQIDAYSAQVLNDMRQYSDALSDEEFEATVDLNFTTTLSNGDEIELCQGGQDKKVTKSNIEEFIALVIKARSAEAFEQNCALREGIDQVFEGNLDVLCYLTPAAIEVRACGEKTIDVERLKSVTTYPNCDQSHEIVTRFWRVFAEFSTEERASYLKFVWGRSRLPMDMQGERRHELRLIDGMSDMAFPQSHTCFFQLDIPFYKTDEMCRKRLIQAAELCGTVDTDNNNFAEE